MTEDGSFSAGSKPIVAKYLLSRIVSRINLQTFQALNRLEASSTRARSFLPSSLAPKLDADIDVYLTPGEGSVFGWLPIRRKIRSRMYRSRLL